MPESKRIGLDLDAAGRVVIAPMEFLGTDIFAAYRLACGQHGASYDSEARAYVALPDLVPALVVALREANTAPVVSATLARNLQDRAGIVRAELAEAQLKLRDVTESLSARGLRLYPFQVAGVAWLANRASALLCDTMGLGKTAQAICALPNTTRALVICPASLKGNWVHELARWRPDLMPMVLAGKNSFVWPQPGQAVILNPDILPRIEAETADGSVAKLKPYADVPQGLTIIADECHMFKGTKTKRTQSFRALAKAARKAGGKTWGLSGTPLLNRPQELYALLVAFDLLKQTFGDWPTFCRSWGAKQRYMGGQDWGEASQAVGPILKRVMLRRRREEVLPDLPIKTRDTVPVDIDRQTQALCLAARQAQLETGNRLGLSGAVSLAWCSDHLERLPFWPVGA